MFSLANILTSCNLFFGCIAVLSVCQNQAEKAMLFLGLGLLCDFLDGFVARWMKQESELGIQLDSLADVVSFGVLPGFMLYILLMNSIEQTSLPIEMSYFAFIITVMASFRLARFNIEADGKVKDFQGLPVPAMTLFVSGIYASFNLGASNLLWIYKPAFIFFTILVLSFMMLSQISILKIGLSKSFLREHWLLILIFVIGLVFVVQGNYLVLSILILVHIVYSIFRNLFIKKV